MTAKAKPVELPEAPAEEALEIVPTAEPETQELHVMSAHQRMVVAMKIIEQTVFQKTQENGKKPLKNGQQADDSYNSVPIDAMRAAVRKACIEAGLVHVGFIGLEYKIDLRQSRYGGTLYHYEGTATFRYINADNPSDYIDFFSAGESNDTGDKALGKMLTNILKSHYKQAWDIGEHGKDDVDSYSNAEMEDEADRIAERRAKSREKASQDPFFSDGLASLRREVGALMARSGEAAEVVARYKAEHGPLPQWSKDVLEACIREAGA